MNRSLNSYILTGCILLTAAMAGCKKDKDLGHADGQPVTIADFTPTTGGAQTEILIIKRNGNLYLVIMCFFELIKTAL